MHATGCFVNFNLIRAHTPRRFETPKTDAGPKPSPLSGLQPSSPAATTSVPAHSRNRDGAGRAGAVQKHLGRHRPRGNEHVSSLEVGRRRNTALHIGLGLAAA